jgi:hypothetical protein
LLDGLEPPGGGRGLDGRVRVRDGTADQRDAHAGRSSYRRFQDLAPRRGPRTGTRSAWSSRRVRGPDPPWAQSLGRAAQRRTCRRGLRAHLQTGPRPAPPDRGRAPGVSEVVRRAREAVDRGVVAYTGV